ncbi:MAG: orotidine-5'-phosphate decarboxylase [Candidatus Omnitrophica bacterium]|nr:orotidine-5'-phosphate decarboxylase [Candidatus Omnitrophota bacterium]
MSDNAKLIVALDVETFEEALGLMDELGDAVEIYKVGSQLFTACGPVVIRHILARGKQVFLDLKFHDIPNTVANAVTAAVNLARPVHEVVDENRQPRQATDHLLLCTLHTQGGPDMLQKAAAAAAKQAQINGVTKTLLVGITVLTSDSKTDNIRDLVLERARLARESGLDGIVASVQEAAMIRKHFGDDFVIVTPGIRPAGADSDDQKRVATPRDAVEAGSNYLVVGRPIVKAENPAQAAQDILKQIANATA